MLEFRENGRGRKANAVVFSATSKRDFHFVLKSERVEVITFGMDAREPEWRIELRHDDRMAEGAEKRVLGGFHVAKEIREMHNAGHVGIGELDATDGGELAGHSGRSWVGDKVAAWVPQVMMGSNAAIRLSAMRAALKSRVNGLLSGVAERTGSVRVGQQ
jgi:hypothetical protein